MMREHWYVSLNRDSNVKVPVMRNPLFIVSKYTVATDRIME